MSENKTAIVTGASGGIGAGLVGALLKAGYIVVAAVALTRWIKLDHGAKLRFSEVSYFVGVPDGI
jgi:NAD(P)-dependent dehydrogenase (short-subunit alcohol dehydrogenase family)